MSQCLEFQEPSHFTVQWQRDIKDHSMHFTVSATTMFFGTKMLHLGDLVTCSFSHQSFLTVSFKALQHLLLALQFLLPRLWIRAAPVRDLLNLKTSRTFQNTTYLCPESNAVGCFGSTFGTARAEDMASLFCLNYPRENTAIEPWFTSPPRSTCLLILQSRHLLQAGLTKCKQRWLQLA